ncbi:hypothetical protein AB9F39_36435, partial [Rhizobium leguminosarum]
GISGGIAGILSVSYLSGSTTGACEMLLPVVVTALLGSVFSRRLVPTMRMSTHWTPLTSVLEMFSSWKQLTRKPNKRAESSVPVIVGT